MLPIANIKDIAKAAGVSVTTVSRVLNSHPYVREDKRRAVQSAIENLNYSRNINAVHLSQGKTNRIGIVLPIINHNYFGAIMEGIAKEAVKEHIQLVMFQSNYDGMVELEALEQLRGSVLDGLIFCSRALPMEMLLSFKSYGPIILCEDAEQGLLPSVSIPQDEAFEFGLDYLISRGHQRIAYSLSRKEGINSHKRIMAYRHKMNQIGETVRTEWLFDHCRSLEDGRRVFGQYLLLKDKPSAFMMTNDHVSTGFMYEAKSHGYSIPGDLAILSFDNHPISEIMGITTIQIPAQQMGSDAFQMYLETVQRPEEYFTLSNHRKKILPYHLYERSTV